MRSDIGDFVRLRAGALYAERGVYIIGNSSFGHNSAQFGGENGVNLLYLANNINKTSQ